MMSDLTLNVNLKINVFKSDTKWVLARRFKRILSDGGDYCWQIIGRGTFLECGRHNNLLKQGDQSYNTKILPLEQYHELVYGDDNWSK